MLPYECKAVKDIVYLAMQENDLATKASDLYKKMLERTEESRQQGKRIINAIKEQKELEAAQKEAEMKIAYQRTIDDSDMIARPLTKEQWDEAFDAGLEEAKRKRGINDIEFKPAEFDITNLPDLTDELPVDINDTILK